MKTMDKVIALGLALGAIVLGIAALGAGSAAAVPTQSVNGYKAATFLVEVEGTQNAEMHLSREPEGPCGTSDHSLGREHLKFHTKHPVKITAFDTPGGGFNPEFFTGKRLSIPTVATLSRSFTPLIQSFRSPECEEDNGGADPGVEETKPDCGTRHVNFPVQLQYSRTKNDGLLLSSGTTDETVFKECPQTASVESFPWLLVEKGTSLGDYITAELSQKDLFDPHFRKWISLAEGSKKVTRAGEWHKTSIQWSVSFTRLKE
jgi:hypothetical protein